MKLFNLSIIGYGAMGSVHHKSINELDNLKLSAVYEPNKNKTKNLSKNIKVFNSYNKFLSYLQESNIDGVIISSPNKYHYKQAADLLKLKVPILIEKPITYTSKEMLELLKLSEKYDTVLRCGLIEIYNPIIEELKKTKFKKLRSIHINRHSPRISSDRRLGDVIFDLLLHDISLLFHVFNPNKIETIGFNKLKLNSDIETFEILLKLDNEISVFISTSRESQIKKRSIEIMDKDSLYVVDLIQKIIYVTKQGSLKSKSGSFTESNKNFKIEPLDRPETAKIQLKAFAENIKNKKIDKNHHELIKKSHEFIFDIN